MEQTQKDNIIKKLIDTHTTVSTMESCTSGMISSSTPMKIFVSFRYVTYPPGKIADAPSVSVIVDAIIPDVQLSIVEEEIIRKYGVYSKECAEEMARTVQEKMHTDIAIGITGTTGNIDPNNADSMQGVVYFCIRVKDKENTFEVHAEVAGMNRHEIKQMYTDMVFEKLQTLVI